MAFFGLLCHGISWVYFNTTMLELDKIPNEEL